MTMLKTLRSHHTPRPLIVCALLCALATIGGVSASGALAGGSSARAAGASTPRAHASASYLTGIGDEGTEMFSNLLWTQLHTKIARYIAPYDAAVRPYSLQLAREWIGDAEAAHQQVLVAFYHSEYTPAKMPSV